MGLRLNGSLKFEFEVVNSMSVTIRCPFCGSKKLNRVDPETCWILSSTLFADAHYSCTRCGLGFSESDALKVRISQELLTEGYENLVEAFIEEVTRYWNERSCPKCKHGTIKPVEVDGPFGHDIIVPPDYREIRIWVKCDRCGLEFAEYLSEWVDICATRRNWKEGKYEIVWRR